jgi:hypothetical protein
VGPRAVLDAVVKRKIPRNKVNHKSYLFVQLHSAQEMILRKCECGKEAVITVNHLTENKVNTEEKVQFK